MSSRQSAVQSESMPNVDERRWVINIRETLEEELEQDVRIPVSVFAVPKPLLATKPEAYTPQMFAVGPYHHWNTQLYDMERYKLATAKRTAKLLKGFTLDKLVDEFARHETVIRAYYHRYLDFTGETLAWLMAIDASFLLEFLRSYANSDGKTSNKVPSMSHMVDSARIKLAFNLILRDVVMLENQIPLFLLREIMQHQSSSAVEDELSKMLLGFVMEVSPFQVQTSLSVTDIVGHHHLLALLYCMIVPKNKLTLNDVEVVEIEQLFKQDGEEDDSGEKTIADSGSRVKQLFSSIWNSLPEGTMEKLKRVFLSRPIKLLIKIPWNIISKLPVVSALTGPIEAMFAQEDDKEGEDEDGDSGNQQPLVEEIMIPSVTELTRAGVKFSPTTGDLTTIQFDTKTATLSIPTVNLDANTEVLLRNLVAYETSVETGPMVFTRYTELINGIVDTEDDVKLLREKGIIVNRMKSDEEVAKLWNGMSKSVRLTKVQFIDKVIEDVNKYYSSRWSVKARKFMRTYVLGSWKILTFMAAMILLLLSFVQAFCTVYSCNARFSEYVKSATSDGGAGD